MYLLHTEFTHPRIHVIEYAECRSLLHIVWWASRSIAKYSAKNLKIFMLYIYERNI